MNSLTRLNGKNPDQVNGSGMTGIPSSSLGENAASQRELLASLQFAPVISEGRNDPRITLCGPTNSVNRLT